MSVNQALSSYSSPSFNQLFTTLHALNDYSPNIASQNIFSIKWKDGRLFGNASATFEDRFPRRKKKFTLKKILIIFYNLLRFRIKTKTFSKRLLLHNLKL